MNDDDEWWWMMMHDDEWWWWWWWMMMNDDEWWWMMMNDDEWWWMMMMMMMNDDDDEWWWMMMNDDEWWWMMMMNDDYVSTYFLTSTSPRRGGGEAARQECGFPHSWQGGGVVRVGGWPVQNQLKDRILRTTMDIEWLLRTLSRTCSDRFKDN